MTTIEEWAEKWNLTERVLPILLTEGYDFLPAVANIPEPHFHAICDELRPGDKTKLFIAIQELKQAATLPVSHSPVQIPVNPAVQPALTTFAPVQVTDQVVAIKLRSRMRCKKCHFYISGPRGHNQYNCPKTECLTLENCPSNAIDLHRGEGQEDARQQREEKRKAADLAKAHAAEAKRQKTEQLHVSKMPGFDSWCKNRRPTLLMISIHS